MAERRDWEHRAIPLSFHGDGVPVVGIGRAGAKSLDTYSYQGVLANGSTLYVKNLIWSMFEQCKATDAKHHECTMRHVWKLLIWSFWFLYLGIHPTVDHTGKAWPPGSSEAGLAGEWLADGHFGVLWMLKGSVSEKILILIVVGPFSTPFFPFFLM